MNPAGGSDNNAGEKAKEDEDLEALLDSAYEELVKVESTKDVPPVITETRKEETPPQQPNGDNNLDDFLSTMEAEFRKLVNAEDPAVLSDMERLTEEFQKTVREQASSTGDDKTVPDFASLLGGRSNVNVEELLRNLGVDSAEGQEAAQDPSTSIMGALLSQLLSHDLLYPAVAQLRDRYPGWLERNQTSPDFERCSRQFEVVKRLCKSYEQQQDSQNSGNKQNLSAIISLVQELQACGDPPAELLEPGEGPLPNIPSQAPSSEQFSGDDECKVQ